VLTLVMAAVLSAGAALPAITGQDRPVRAVAPDVTAGDARDRAREIVARIQRADDEGDRAALRHLYEERTPFRSLNVDARLASRLIYWQGFALWRRAFNGFNESADPKDLERDLEQAVRDFEAAVDRDPAFVDARIGAISCLQNLTFLHRDEAARVQELVARFVRLFKESDAAEPDNPRLLWVRGASQWYNPPERGGGQSAALATYEKGLTLARAQRGAIKDPLEPAWGEPELLINLAWSNLNQTPPSAAAAEEYAQKALALVPYWHYVRDILLPQIRSAKGKR